MLDLKNKVVLVTGAVSGIGLAYVQELLQNEVKGVTLVDINVEKGEEVLNEFTKTFGKNRAIFVKADVSNRTEFEDAFETTVKTFKQLDIVINNAGIIQEIQWEKCVGVNLTGVITGSMLAMEKYFPKYKSGPEGVVLNTASIVALQPYEETPTYAATKGAIVGFTRAMGGEVHRKTTNLRILAICPGLTDTAILNINTKQVPEPYLSACLNNMQTLAGQKPEIVAKHAMDIIKSAPTGSVWLVSDGNCKRVEFPTYSF